MAKQLWSSSGERREQLEQWRLRSPHADAYARFRAVVAHQRKVWSDWPSHLREGRLEQAEFDQADYRYHLYAQFAIDEQLSGLAQASRDGLAGLYLDLPVGVHRDGFDTWREQELFVPRISAGAPPDSFFRSGQNWGFPPLNPERSRLQHHRYFRACLHQHLRVAQALRIDHVMGLHRLYWIPPGFPATEGVYVTYPAEELYAIVTLESHRHRARVIGEDLGTVPDEVRESMSRHGLLRMYVVQMQAQDRDEALSEPAADTVACLNTHDMPTLAAFWQGLDIDRRVGLGLWEAELAESELEQRDLTRKALESFLRRLGLLDEITSPQLVLRALLRYLGSSRACLVMASLEDLWLEPEPQNVPGTHSEQPNWKRKARVPVDSLERSAEVIELLDLLSAARGESRHAAGDRSFDRPEPRRSDPLADPDRKPHEP
ncbi:MAG: 4-alpha-glucanotransferase [Acidobacteriota bacterium]|nr:MAG: 4-alpha-glucanotransferase [Acidobacteriota bacterium]